MLIKELTLDGFRNYTHETVDFDNGVNVICGRNAQGKTNLIEAVFYLATGRSLRPAVDKDLINSPVIFIFLTPLSLTLLAFI